MIDIKYTPAHLKRLDAITAAAKANSRALREEVRQVIWEGNRLDRLQGVDARGKKLPRVKPRTGRYAGATGEPMVPFNEASRAIAAFYTDDRVQGEGFIVSAGFRGPGVEILAYHAEGRAGTGRKGQVTGIVRDVFGVSERTRKAVIEVFREHARMTFAGKIRAGVRSLRRGMYQSFGIFRAQGRS